MVYRYKTHGTCAGYIDVEVENGILKQAIFHGGCNGNLQALSRLVPGMSLEQLKNTLSGIRCGFKQTSCPDQLVKAVEAAIAQEEAN